MLMSMSMGLTAGSETLKNLSCCGFLWENEYGTRLRFTLNVDTGSGLEGSSRGW